MKRTYLPLLILWILVGCSTTERPHPPSISDEQFINFSAEAAVLTREAKLAGQDSLTIRARVDSLHRALHVSEAQIEEAVTWYRADLQKWEAVTARVIRRIDEMQKSGK